MEGVREEGGSERNERSDVRKEGVRRGGSEERRGGRGE